MTIELLDRYLLTTKRLEPFAVEYFESRGVVLYAVSVVSTRTGHFQGVRLHVSVPGVEDGRHFDSGTIIYATTPDMIGDPESKKNIRIIKRFFKEARKVLG